MSTSEPKRHSGTFAEGEGEPDQYPGEEHVGTFAEGEAEPDQYPDEEHVGTFAEGEGEPDGVSRRGARRNVRRRRTTRSVVTCP
jgi:hypothetical protein